MTVKIAAAWKKDEREFNGLESIAKELVDEPLLRRTAVVILETIRITREIADGGVEIPTVRILHVEPLADAQAVDARKLLDDAYQTRTGKDHGPQHDLFTGSDYEPDDDDED